MNISQHSTDLNLVQRLRFLPNIKSLQDRYPLLFTRVYSKRTVFAACSGIWLLYIAPYILIYTANRSGGTMSPWGTPGMRLQLARHVAGCGPASCSPVHAPSPSTDWSLIVRDGRRIPRLQPGTSGQCRASVADAGPAFSRRLTFQPTRIPEFAISW